MKASAPEICDFIREGIVSHPRETSYQVTLSESDVIALQQGIVTPFLREHARLWLGWPKEDEEFDARRNAGSSVDLQSSASK